MSQTTSKHHIITVRGASIAVTERGSGAPMLFLHGSPDTSDMWTPVMDRLNGYAHLIAPDMPGYGQSTLPRDFSLELDHLADFIRDLLDALNVKKPAVLVGTDFGVHYALAFAVKYPERIRGVVVSNSGFSPDYEWHSFAKLYRVPLLGEFLLAGSNKSVISKTLKGFAPALPDDYIDASYAAGFGSPSVRKTILRMYRERDPQDFIGWESRLRDVLASKPALVLWGDRDPFITPQFAEKFGAKDVVHFNEFSHWLPLEAPDAYAANIKEWMRGIN